MQIQFNNYKNIYICFAIDYQLYGLQQKKLKLSLYIMPCRNKPNEKLVMICGM